MLQPWRIPAFSGMGVFRREVSLLSWIPISVILFRESRDRMHVPDVLRLRRRVVFGWHSISGDITFQVVKRDP